MKLSGGKKQNTNERNGKSIVRYGNTHILSSALNVFIRGSMYMYLLNRVVNFEINKV